MFTDFIVLCANTVPESYTWDLGTPLQTGPTKSVAYSTVSSVSGYAPALNVIFANTSLTDEGFDFIDYTWDFGDYYHDSNNFISLSCTSLVQHTYIMPGIYTVTLKHIQSRGAVETDLTNAFLKCRGKFGIRWFWDELNQFTITDFLTTANIKSVTWDQAMCVPPATAIPPRPKWWDSEEACFQKYCKAWSWYDLAENSGNPTKWSETEVDQIFQKKWMYEANDTICSVSALDFLNTTETTERSVIKQFIVNVKEIAPVAQMYSVSAYHGPSPHTVRLSPRNSKPGSFPIDRIDWDFGDGTPIKTVTRYALPSGADIVNSEYFTSDVYDIRNIDVLHTYTRNKNTYSVFYPSLTCYSANTGTSDACSITIGPITLPSQPTEFHILKTRNTLKGNIYTFSENNNIALATTTPIVTSFISRSPIPSNTLRDGRNLAQNFYGYRNNLSAEIFPPFYYPSCEFVPLVLPDKYIIVENPIGPAPFGYGALSGEEVPITTEFDLFITP
jgi:PKD repeat protein